MMPNQSGSQMRLKDTRISRYTWFLYVKHDWHHKARLVAGGHLSPDPIDSIYSGVVSTRSLRLPAFSGEQTLEMHT